MFITGVAGVGPGTAGSILVNGVGATAAAAAGLQLSLNLLGPQNAAPNAALAAQFVDHIKVKNLEIIFRTVICNM